jgi:hypothetical protein
MLIGTSAREDLVADGGPADDTARPKNGSHRVTLGGSFRATIGTSIGPGTDWLLAFSTRYEGHKSFELLLLVGLLLFSTKFLVFALRD